ncbi:hypothetical protein ABTM93_19355, partial [Acinetobacter baumannii]
EYEEAIAADKKADVELVAATKAASAPGLSAEQSRQAQQRKTAAEKDKDKTSRLQVRARRSWDKERDSNEPTKVKLFRASLLQCQCVSQLF